MPNYSQDDRPLVATTPLGKDVLLLTAFRGQEEISRLFCFELELLAELNSEVPFEDVVGQDVTVELELLNQDTRYFNGIVKRFCQGRREERFVHYRAELVPKAWLLTKTVRNRIFQHLTIPDILQQAFAGYAVEYDLLGSYHPRDYCVQYQESDFQFVSRLMEEEGIYYFFRHTDGGHTMVLTDVPNKHPGVPGQSAVIYETVTSTADIEEMRITSWEKSQELRSGEVTLWDHCFELPGKHLEASEHTIDTIKVGKITHKLHLGTDRLEIYEYPGRYAQRFDGVDAGGAARPEELQDVFKDKDRTVRIRMEEEEANALSIAGTSNCGQFVAGHRFDLQRHHDADDRYLLTRVDHNARLNGYATGESHGFTYENKFWCIPAALAYRPQRVTPRPVIAGVQTATVVGPSGAEIFCDKYGRIKVQFHWDREGKNDGCSSCWLRVAQVWAGRRWGAFFWPRIGHEVVVTFEEGDPDQPLVIGSVYNAENMPPLSLPTANMYAGIKSHSLRGEASANFNSIIFVDKEGQEHMALQSERHMVVNAEYDVDFRAGRHHAHRIPGVHITTVGSFPGGGGSGGGPKGNE